MCLEVVGVIAVAEIGHDRDRQLGARRRQPAHDRGIGIDLAPGPLVPRLQFRRRHLLRLEDHVLAVVELPVPREDAALALEPVMQRRAGERREDRKARQVDRGVDGKLHGLVERIFRVVLVAEHEAALHADAERVQIAHQRAVERRIVEPLADVAQARVADGLETDQQAGAAAARHQLHQLAVAPDQAGGEAEPPHPERRETREQLGGVGAIRNQVEVDEDDPALAEAPDVLDHVSNRLLELLAAPRRRHHAELAVVRAGARRLEHRLGEEVPSVQQLPARERQVGQLEIRPLVVALSHLPAGEIAQQLRPGLLRIADTDGIGMLLGLLRHQRDVRTAEHHGNAARAIVASDLVGAHGAAGDDRQSDQIGGEIERDILDAFVVQHEFDVELGRGKRRQRGQRQRLVAQRFFEDSAAAAIERSLRRKQRDLHATLGAESLQSKATRAKTAPESPDFRCPLNSSARHRCRHRRSGSAA